MRDAVDQTKEELEDALLSFEEVALQGLDTAGVRGDVVFAADRFMLAAADMIGADIVVPGSHAAELVHARIAALHERFGASHDAD